MKLLHGKKRVSVPVLIGIYIADRKVILVAMVFSPKTHAGVQKSVGTDP